MELFPLKVVVGDCIHCGMPGHTRADCSWAKQSDRELAQEAARRAGLADNPTLEQLKDLHKIMKKVNASEPDIDIGGF